MSNRNRQGRRQIEWPDGKDFAFAIFDDTDRATLQNVRPVYDAISDLGFLTTKSVWPLRGNNEPVGGGDTLEDTSYKNWILELQAEGFEIGYHMGSYHTSHRSETIQALNRFREIVGHDPHTMANHVGCDENIYWGAARFHGLTRIIYNVLTRFKHRDISKGHLPNHPLFWGDLCHSRVRYVRDFAFKSMNTLSECPQMPYYDPRKPYVRAWFACSQGSTVSDFNHTIREEEQDRLEEERGACIMYTHFGFNFFKDGAVNQEFQRLMGRLSKKNGWFVPVGNLLEFLEQRNGLRTLTKSERNVILRKWFLQKIRTGTT